MISRRSATAAAVVSLIGFLRGGIARADCDQQMLSKLLDRGFSKDEILRMCGAGPLAPPPVGEPNAGGGAPPQAGGQRAADEEPVKRPTKEEEKRAKEEERRQKAAEDERKRQQILAKLIGTWEGEYGPNHVVLTFRQGGSYRMSFAWQGAPEGTATAVQIGTWGADEDTISMKPSVTGGQRVPGYTETHTYELEDGGDTLTLQGELGTLRLNRS